MLPKIKVPFPVRGDAYTVAAPLTSPKAIERSVYNLTFRLSPQDAFVFAKNDNILFYGLTDYLTENLLDPVTIQDVLNSERFMRDAHAFGYGLPFDKEMWMRAIREFNGRLPVVIEAVPLGATIFPNEPFLQVTSLSKGYGEIAALLEAVLVGQISIASSALTMRRQLLAAMEEYVREDEPELDDAAIRFKASIMIHDFGMRAHANQYESAMLGRAHLLVFPGTDTFNAAYEAWQLAHCNPVGSSIAALAHRSVQSFPDQLSCFLNAAAKAIESAGDNTAIVSLVSDCYDFNATIEGDLKTTCEKYPQLVAVARPDSGDYVANVLKIVTEAKNAGCYTVQKNGRIAMTTRRFIQGDSMNWTKMVNVMNTLKANGFSPVNCGIFGVGGWLRNVPTRDTLSAAYKLSAIGEDEEPVVKLSHTRAKMSVPGPVKVLRNTDEGAPTVYFANEENVVGDNLLVSYYDGRLTDPFESPCNENFLNIKDRVQIDFDRSVMPEQVLSPRILAIQDKILQKYDRCREDFEN